MGTSPLEGLIMGTRCGDIDPVVIEFICTLSAWGATFSKRFLLRSGVISTHAPRVGSDGWQYAAKFIDTISAHAPRMGSDESSCPEESAGQRFQPTLPAWGATGGDRQWNRAGAVSTHAPRVGSDRTALRRSSVLDNFNPRSPRGERLSPITPMCWYRRFQPTLPAWGATTQTTQQAAEQLLFQPTLPAWGATFKRIFSACCLIFQPTLPAWGATQGDTQTARIQYISTHAPRVGSDTAYANHAWKISTHAPRVGSDKRFARCAASPFQFQPTLPAWGATWVAGQRLAPGPISTHAPRVGSDQGDTQTARIQYISTHAPRVGSDKGPPSKF